MHIAYDVMLRLEHLSIGIPGGKKGWQSCAQAYFNTLCSDLKAHF